MNTFKLTIASPDGNKFAGECEKLDVRGVEGELAVMAGHVPFVTCVIKCECTVWLPDGTKRAALTDGGLLSVGKDEVTLLSGSCRFVD